MKREVMFKTEAELCAAFIAWVKLEEKEWTAYPETAGWDILLAHADGTQIGVQAKLRFNMKVLEQCVESGSAWLEEPGPDFRAVLVPVYEGSVNLCDALGVTVIWARVAGARDERIEFEPDLDANRHRWRRWHYRNPVKRCALPEYVPDVPAGVPAPAQLTDWKIGALKLSAIMELRGYLTRTDFRTCGVDHRRWTEQWLEAVPDRPGAWRWFEGKNPGFQHQHPTIYPLVLEKMRAAGGNADVPAGALL